jgi:hypothetical protein
MTPNDFDPNDLDLPKERVTVNMDKLDHEIVTHLIGVIGNSKSAVIGQMVKEWINQNSDKILKTWDIDLIALKRKIIAEAKGIDIEKELQPYEEDLIEEFPKFFDNVPEIQVEIAAQMLHVSISTFRKIVLYHNKKLKDLGLNLVYKNDIIINKSYDKDS